MLAAIITIGVVGLILGISALPNRGSYGRGWQDGYNRGWEDRARLDGINTATLHHLDHHRNRKAY